MFSFIEKIINKNKSKNYKIGDEKLDESKPIPISISLMGSDNSVGCSFLSLILYNYIKSQGIKTIILIDSKKKEKYTKIKKELDLQKIEIGLNINYEKYQNYEIIIRDFGVLDRNVLNAEFIESDKKILITTSSIFHRSSINNILQYTKKTEDYNVSILFNKTSKNVFETWKKFFLEKYNIKNTFHLDLISDISEYEESDIFMNSFRKEFFKNI